MSTILVNTLTGTSTAGSIAVTGEGNSTTTNLQQGLAKVSGSLSMAGTAAIFSGSLNTSSLTDNGTGDGTIAFTNSFSNTTHAYQFNGKYDDGASNDDVPNVGHFRQATSASNVRFIVQVPDASNAAVDGNSVTFTVFGDLA